MALILNIETATTVCSVTLALDGQEVATKEIRSAKYSHSENLNVFIESSMNASDFALKDLDAVAVSQGPGSYTGLRIGVSCAKGLCYGLNIPLISVNSLQALANLSSQNVDYIVPMFDARRMEVYSMVLDCQANNNSEVEAKIIDKESFSEILNKGQVMFMGPGAEKCQDVIKHPNAIFELTTQVSAKGMVSLSEDKFNHKLFEDVAYFEPFYLKDFIAGTPKKMI